MTFFAIIFLVLVQLQCDASFPILDVDIGIIISLIGSLTTFNGRIVCLLYGLH